MRSRFLSLCLGLVLAVPGIAAADPWKDESGNGRRDRDARGAVFLPVPPPPRAPGWVPVPAAPRVPHGHLPPPGECRPWIPGVPAGQQPPPHRC
ncbi:hypothetical protein [Roseomonas sp. HF4]|uniref:hypothetical protein n=1 Tax=Roseomonas sp. HF4 TaxID=2562313 RepID=UPI0010BF70C9|nr:hypothetical protein [Roseomonas sp. HF4]